MGWSIGQCVELSCMRQKQGVLSYQEGHKGPVEPTVTTVTRPAEVHKQWCVTLIRLQSGTNGRVGGCG